nr:hypothetical protein XACG102_8680014 [Xanthomonas citri pv. citri]
MGGKVVERDLARLWANLARRSTPCEGQAWQRRDRGSPSYPLPKKIKLLQPRPPV